MKLCPDGHVPHPTLDTAKINRINLCCRQIATNFYFQKNSKIKKCVSTKKEPSKILNFELNYFVLAKKLNEY